MSTVAIRADAWRFDPYTNQRVVNVDDIPSVIADYLDVVAQRYPAEVFTAEGGTPDGIAGTAIRLVLTAEVVKLRRGEGE